MSYQYPSGDEIQLAEDQIDDVMNEPIIRAVAEAYRREAEKQEQASSTVDTSDTSPDEQEFADNADEGAYGEEGDLPEPYLGGDGDFEEEELLAPEFGDTGDFDEDEELPAPVITSQEEVFVDTPPQSAKSDLMPKSFDPKKGYNQEYRRNDYSYTDRDWTFEDPYDPVDPKDFDRQFVCRTNEYDPDTGRQKLIEANPNDPRHLIEAMEMSAEIMDSNRVRGLIKRFEKANTTTAISMTFSHEAMGAVYRDNGLNFEVMSNPSSSRVSIQNGNLNSKTQNCHSYHFLSQNKDFHRLFQDNFLMQMNHRLTQEAIERNREYFPSGVPLGNPDKEGFTFDKFKAISQQCAQDAFSRTQIQIDLIKQHEIALERNKAFAEQFKKEMAPKIKNESMIEGFGREFKVHKGETHTEAVKRMRLEFKEHGKKFCDGLEGRGIDLILAQGLAKSRQSDQVTDAHIREANNLWKEMRNNPLKYNSTERMIREVTGSNQDLHKSLMHNLDGRSTFQRSLNTMQRYGEHLNCYADNRTRIRDEDRQAAKAFAASTLMTSKEEDMATRMRKTMEHNNLSPSQAIGARNRMLLAEGKLTTNQGQPITREEIRQPLLEKATNKAAKEMEAKQAPKPDTPPGPDDEGPEPGGPTKGKGKGRGM